MMIYHQGVWVDVPSDLVHSCRRDFRQRGPKKLKDVVTFRLSEAQYKILDELRQARDPDLPMSAWCRGIILYWMISATRGNPIKTAILSKGFDDKAFHVKHS